jgi:hypothetical protein
MLIAPAAHAQSGTSDYLFRKPLGSMTLRGGYLASNTSGEPFTVMKEQTTIEGRSFDGLNLGFDLSFFATRRFDVMFSLDASGRTTDAEYREWEENGRPIVHTSSLTRASIGGSIRYNLVDRGRQISSLAWIPARYVPYVGIGGGWMGYELKQEGDFVEVNETDSADIFSDELESMGTGPMSHAFAGIDFRFDSKWSFLGEARYTRASAKLTNNYSTFGRIDLSGLALNIGARFRF